MPHSKLANAMVTHPRVTGRGWDRMRRVASSGATNRNLTDQARDILGGSLDPDKFLFTHCTIVASVDVDAVAGVKLGKVKIGSQTVDRRYADFYIKPECSQFVNNNGDSWSRDVLLASYPTFIGGQNFQEHVQIDEKSKGRIIDAVARDIGDSVYIDILVATNRKHAKLIGDIESGAMSTLSMGCTTDFTICSKCGHYAVDETDLCDHIKIAKLNTFLDDANQTRVIAELCGHIDYTENDEAPGGVQFIEASWVAVPAFSGAVLNKVVATGETGVEDSELRRLLMSAGPSWSDQAIARAASGQNIPIIGETKPTRVAFDFGGDEEGGDEEGGDEKPAEPEVPFKDLEDNLYQRVKDRVQTRIEKELEEKKDEKPLPAADWTNDTLNKEASSWNMFQGRSLPKNAQALLADWDYPGEWETGGNWTEAWFYGEDVSPDNWIVVTNDGSYFKRGADHMVWCAAFVLGDHRASLKNLIARAKRDSLKTMKLGGQAFRTSKVAAQKRYAVATAALVRAASSEAALVDGIASINQSFGVKASVEVYRAALKAGPTSKYSTSQTYVLACSKAAGRDLSPAELRVVVRVGTLLARWVSSNNPSHLSKRSSP
jgi:hypothetical protein